MRAWDARSAVRSRWLTFLGGDRAHTHLCDKGQQTSSRIDKCSLSHPLDPLLCRIGFHPGGSVDAESLRISEELDYLVGDDLRLKERSSATTHAPHPVCTLIPIARC